MGRKYRLPETNGFWPFFYVKPSLTPIRSSITAKSVLRVESKEELRERMYKYFEEINTVPVPYKWKYRMDTIHLEDEDVSKIVYEVVNAKAASSENQGKRASVSSQRKKKEQTQEKTVES